MLSSKSEPDIQRHDLRSGIGTEMLTAKELGAMLKIDVKTIYSYVQRGLIPYVRIQSNLRFSKPEIQAWIEGQSHRPRLVRNSSRLAAARPWKYAWSKARRRIFWMVTC